MIYKSQRAVKRIAALGFFFILVVGFGHVALRLWAEYYAAKGDLIFATYAAPFHYNYLFLRSVSEFNKGNCSFAIPTLKSVLHYAPNYWNAMNNLALCYVAIKDLDGAERLWKKLLAQWPYHEKARINLNTLIQLRMKNGN